MIVTVVDSAGKPIYSGSDANEKVSRLDGVAGNFIVDGLPPSDETKWDGSAWVRDTDRETENLRQSTLSKIELNNSRMAQLAEDLTDLLVVKGLIALADLSQENQDALSERKALQASLP